MPDQTPEQTPYDEDRAAYSRTALARLVVSDHAASIATAATAMVGTRGDADVAFGGRVSEAVALIPQARELLAAAVVYERERGATWVEIASYLDPDGAFDRDPDRALDRDAEAVAARFAPDLGRWQDAFEHAYRLDDEGIHRVPALPGAAYDPVAAGSRLDVWASTRVWGGATRWAPHEVTESLDAGLQARRPASGGS